MISQSRLEKQTAIHTSMATSFSVPVLHLLIILLSISPFTSPTTITIPVFPSTADYPSSDPWKLLNHLASVSLSRAHQLKSPRATTSPSLLTSPLFSRSYGGYSMSLGFGTPPQSLNFVMDTGSSLVWFPCTSRYLCSGCNFPNLDITKLPKFIPKLSFSSKIIGCKNPKCAWIFGSNVQSQCQECDSNTKNCSSLSCPPYLIQYGLGCTAGLLLSENLDFPNKTVPDFLVGCSILSTRQPEGIAGFGRSPQSLPHQMGVKKFSYCLVSRRFDDAPVSSDLVLDMGPVSDSKTRGVSYTPFSKNPVGSNAAFQEYYYVTLRKIIVGNKKVKVPYSFLVPESYGNGGTIVDSGSTFTFMEGPVFELVAKEFENQMRNYTIASDVQNQTGLRPCFNISGETSSVLVPELIFQFKGGAKMQLPLSNYFAFVESGVVCLTIVSNGAEEGGEGRRSGPAIILGNFQQQNFYIEYDLENERFGFKQQRCA